MPSRHHLIKILSVLSLVMASVQAYAENDAGVCSTASLINPNTMDGGMGGRRGGMGGGRPGGMSRGGGGYSGNRSGDSSGLTERASFKQKFTLTKN